QRTEKRDRIVAGQNQDKFPSEGRLGISLAAQESPRAAKEDTPRQGEVLNQPPEHGEDIGLLRFGCTDIVHIRPDGSWSQTGYVEKTGEGICAPSEAHTRRAVEPVTEGDSGAKQVVTYLSTVRHQDEVVVVAQISGRKDEHKEKQQAC